MTDDRLAHLAEIAPALWPAPHVSAVGRATPGEGKAAVAEFLLLPSSRRPRVLAPAGRRSSAAVVRHHGEGRGRTDRLLAGALSVGLRAGLGRVLWRERWHVGVPAGSATPTLAGHLSDVLGRDVVLGMHLGPPRANRKPVLQLLDRRGRTLAYAKLGVNALTDALVRAESGALAELGRASIPSVRTPELLHAGRWHGHDLMVQAALPVWSARRPLTADRLVAGAAEIAGLGRTDGVRLQTSSFWADLSTRIALLPPQAPAQRLRELVGRLGDAAGTTALSFGASHGDWAPWNMACVADRLLVWDWERFRRSVPVGFDLLHHGLQHDLVVRADDPPAAALRLVEGAAARLAPLGAGRQQALATVSLYLADLATRYLTDNQLEAGAALGDVGTYLLPALDLGTGRLEGEPR